MVFNALEFLRLHIIKDSVCFGVGDRAQDCESL